MAMDKVFTLGQCLVTPAEFSIQAKGHDKKSLQPKMIEVLCYLAKHYPRVIPRDELIENIWGENSYVGDKSLTNAIWHLRKHLTQTKDNHDVEVIETIRKAGYRLLIEPQWQDESASVVSDSHNETTVISSSRVKLSTKWSLSLAVLVFTIMVMIFVIDTNKNTESHPEISQITKHPGSELFPSPSPDGRYVVYSQLSTNQPINLYMKDTWQPQLAPKQLTFDNATEGHSVWSHDGQYLYFSRKDKQARKCKYIRLKVLSHQETELADCPMKGGYYYLDISPDDKTLAVYNDEKAAEDTGIHFIDLTDESFPIKRFSCAQNCGYKDRDMAFSPDGKSMLVSRRVNRFNENIFLVNIADNSSKQLTFGEEDIVGFTWYPDGKHVVFATQRADIKHGFILNTKSLKQHKVDIAGFSYPSIAKQGNQLFFQQRQENQFIASLPLHTEVASTPFPIMRSNASHRSADYNAHTNKLAYVSNESGHFELWTARADGSERTQITQLKQTISYPKWSHNGKHIAFLSSADAGSDEKIYIYSTENQKIKQLKTPFAKHHRPSWSLDDKNVLTAIYTNEFVDIHSIHLQDNSIKRLTFDGGRFAIMATPSIMLYTKLKRGLWQKDLSKNDELKQTESKQVISGKQFSTLYAWAHHQGKVYFQKTFKDHQHLVVADLNSNTIEPLVQLPLNSISNTNKLTYVTNTDNVLFTSDSYPKANIQAISYEAILH
ncbi:winged helix-turn-helix domain-containing protein [Litorilituus lipolyticus]|uniref:OmpR/PhoB-type domain-containing protein n=1 Tax=Litorilituus lipolyticus TaxID=2491017 RepID=A0A502L3M3_9GAMM|nr:winged helix-turn-helix domain-containing protein [Litorilituus lipolyticus]TPH18558.1 hypothetical protein EPA86_02045 [Litorilituus lipolyticus]